jgi:amicyanin
MDKKIIVILVIIAVVVIGMGAYYFLQQPGSVQYIQTNSPNGQSNQPPNNQANQPSSNETASNPQTYNVTIQNLAFNPAQLTIKKGDTVIWTNKDSMNHQVSGNGFQSNPFGNGQTFSFTFNTAGTFDYICLIHPYMKGKIIVQ